MKKIFRVLLTAVIALLLATNANAAEAPEWQADLAHSGVYFGIQHIYSTVKGSFDDFNATIQFDPNNLKESRFDFTVKVDSINTRNTKRDNHLKSGDFFDANKYPNMSFKSKAIKHLEGDRYSVDGTLTVKDVSQEVAVPFTFFGVKANPFNDKMEVAGFEAHMTIDRLQYNVGGGKFLKMGVVGKDADVLISIEATRKK